MGAWAAVDGLVLEGIDGETVVFDPSSQKVHALNRAAALVLRHCDGRTTPESLAAILRDDTGLPADERIVDLALHDLHQAGLIAPIGPLPATAMSRRALIRRLGMSAGLAAMLPLVESLVLPAPALAQSPTPTPTPTPPP